MKKAEREICGGKKSLRGGEKNRKTKGGMPRQLLVCALFRFFLILNYFIGFSMERSRSR